MVEIEAMPTVVVAVVDALNSLLEAEANSIFHFVGPGSPYVQQASPRVRESLGEVVARLDRHQQELVDLIRKLGGRPSIPSKPRAEDQYLSYLSLKSLLPKLVEAKQLMIQRYQNALSSVEGNTQAAQLLEKHIEDMLMDMQQLNQAAAEVAGPRNPSNVAHT